MKQRLLKLSVALLVPMTILAILLAFSTDVRTVKSPVNNAEQTIEYNVDKPSIIARRLTSIPYTVNTMLPLLADGQTVQTSGTGTCADIGETFTIQVTVVQIGQQYRAMGVTEGDCATQNGWAAVATNPGNQTLMPGPAEVCGHATIYGGPEGTLVGDWCVDVMLQ